MSGDVWISGKEAASQLSEQSGKPISHVYVRQLAKLGKITHRARDKRTHEYLKSDLDGYIVGSRAKKRQRG